MTLGHRIHIKRGWRVGKDGRIRKSTAHMDVCARLKAASSKRVRVVKRTTR